MRLDEPARAGPAETEVSAAYETETVTPTVSMPERIGPYRVDALLGRGGMGEVYRAWDPRLERQVAVKRILSEAAHPKARARFWREARVLAQLNHDNLVALHDIGEEGGQLYLAMELIEGHALSEARSARWPIAEAVELVRQIAQAVGTAHRREIVHRDIKPSNILIEGSGRPRLIDFGLARRVDEDEVTQAGAVVGTWSWMAPEQIAGEPMGPQTDVHALGALLFALLVGQPPYQRETREATAAAILAGARPDLRAARPDVPGPLEQIIRASLDRDVSKRPADGEVLAEMLGRWLSNEGLTVERDALLQAFMAARSAIKDPGISTGLASRTSSRRRSRKGLVVGAVLGALALVSVLFWTRGEESPLYQVDIEHTDSDAAGLARSALRTRPRKSLAVLPLRDADGRPHRLGGVAAELVREDLAHTSGLTLLPWRAMLAHSDVPPEALTAASWNASQLDGVIEGVISEEGDDLLVTLEVRRAGTEQQGLLRVSMRTTEMALIPAMRAGVAALCDELGVAMEVSSMPRGGASPRGSARAIEALLEAERALHAEHWRAFRRHIRDALVADPELPRARLHDAVLDIATEHMERAKEKLRRLSQEDVPERDKSVAQVFLQRYSGGAPVVDTIEKHLERFPDDLEMKLELLREMFRASGKGKLSRVIDYAEEILAGAPRATQAASKLARALTWTEGSEAARKRLARFGVERVEGQPRVTDFVFGELDLYAGRPGVASETFAHIVEGDGDMTYYAAHMRVVARMLVGDCDEAYDEVLSLLRGATTAEGALGVDWTYLLGIHALMCADRIDEAYDMALTWPERLGLTSGAKSYRSLVRTIEMLVAPDPSQVAHALLETRDGHNLDGPGAIVIQYGQDPEAIRGYLLAGRKLHSNQAENTVVDQGLRSLRGLEARARFLEGDIEGALDLFASLANSGVRAIREGDIYEQIRWRAIYAQHLQLAGYDTLARENWQSVLDGGFGRVLAMETTWQAKVALARLSR